MARKIGSEGVFLAETIRFKPDYGLYIDLTLTHPPRLSLSKEERAEVEAVMDKALKTRPVLPDVGLKPAA